MAGVSEVDKQGVQWHGNTLKQIWIILGHGFGLQTRFLDIIKVMEFRLLLHITTTTSPVHS